MARTISAKNQGMKALARSDSLIPLPFASKYTFYKITHKRLDLSTEVVSCRLLQRITRTKMD